MQANQPNRRLSLTSTPISTLSSTPTSTPTTTPTFTTTPTSSFTTTPAFTSTPPATTTPTFRTTPTFTTTPTSTTTPTPTLMSSSQPSTTTDSDDDDSITIINTKRISPSESLIIASAYEYHGGKWKAIMSDPKIKKLKRTETHLKNHLEYLRKKKNKKTTGERGTKRRREIVSSIEDSIGDDTQGVEEGMTSVINNGPLELQEDEQEAEYNTPNSPRSRLIFDVDNESLSETVRPSQIGDAESYRDFVLSSRERQEARHEAIRKKVRERNEQIRDIREQREERKENNEIRNLLMMMIVQQQQQQQQTNNLLNMALLKYLNNDDKDKNGSSPEDDQ